MHRFHTISKSLYQCKKNSFFFNYYYLLAFDLWKFYLYFRCIEMKRKTDQSQSEKEKNYLQYGIDQNFKNLRLHFENQR